MTVRAHHFSPEVMLSAPRRSAGIPNADGTKVLYSVSEYSFSTHSQKREVRVLDVESKETVLVTDEGVAGFEWLGDEVLLLTSGEGDVTDVKVGKVEGFRESCHTIATINGPVDNLKICPGPQENQYGLAVSAKATPVGELYNPSTAKKPHTSGRLYKSTFVRHWDHYVTENRNAIWVAKLTREDGKFQMSDLRNALKDTGLESPVEPFPGTEHFDINKHGLVFTAKDPDLNPALHTKTNIYFVSHDIWSSEEVRSTSVKKIEVDGFDGAKTSPVFSPDGDSIAFLAMKADGYEADKNQVFLVPDLSHPEKVEGLFPTEDGKGAWDRSPSGITFGKDWSILFLTAEDHGRGCLFAIDFTQEDFTQIDAGLPKLIVKGGNVADVRPLKNEELFISSSSLIDNSLYSVLDLESTYMYTYNTAHKIYTLPDGITPANETTRLVSSMNDHGAKFGLSRKQVEEVHWPGAAEGTSVHAWVVKPSNFSSKKEYPLAFLIHGGPQGAWEDSWSTRWNPAVFAEQGYVVVCPNPTGSTGYGQAFTNAIQGQWGGLPYEDLVNGVDWIDENMGYVDMDRAVALGASYGGYMVNWIQGHPLGRRFKALVCHDGVFSMTGQLASEELYFPFHDLEGPLWKDPESWAKWDPSQYTGEWRTPQLVIHSELDYRLTISEGLAAFHTLQAKGVESEFLTFPDENHWVLKPENSLLWHKTVLDWINGHVGLKKSSEHDRR